MKKYSLISDFGSFGKKAIVNNNNAVKCKQMWKLFFIECSDDDVNSGYILII